MRWARRTGDAQARHAVVRTLEAMADGGIHDHVGGGFHRYSTDQQWLVPHFEKMLYDNAELASAYIDGWKLSGKPRFADVVRDTLDWILHRMTSRDGAFWSATDADSPGPDGKDEEGRFFTWTPDEIGAAVGDDRAPLVRAYFGVTADGQVQGRSVLHVTGPLDEVASKLGIAPDAAARDLDEARALLYETRQQRKPPPLDDDVLTAWNGFAISAFARASEALEEQLYAVAAERAADFLMAHLKGSDGRLRRSFRDGKAKNDATLVDYASLISALLDLYEATGHTARIEQAIALQRVVDAHYADGRSGAYFMTADDAEPLLAREVPSEDGDTPSGNALEAMNLLRLSELTEKASFRTRAERLFAAFADDLARRPTAMPAMLEALDFYLDAPLHIVVVTPNAESDAGPMLAPLHHAFVPSHLLSVVSADEVASEASLLPDLAGKQALGDKVTAYVCEHGRCKEPTTDPAVLAREIAEVHPLPAG